MVDATHSGNETADAAPSRSLKARLLPVFAVVILAAAAWFGWRYWTEGRFMVTTDDAYVQADSARVAARVEGYVAELPVAENQHVAAGDVLVRLEDDDYRNALETARSRFSTADATLARIDAQITAAEASVEQARAQRQSAQAQLTNAQSSAERAQSLFDRQATAKADLDRANEELSTAKANLASAEAAISSAEAQVAVLRAQREESEGDRRQLELAVDQAQRDLDRTVLRAPFDGVLANRAVEVGDLVSPGSQLAALVPDDGLYIEANYKETQMPGVVPGAVVHITFDALPDHEFEGRVTSAAPATGSVFSLLPAENATGNFTKVVQRVPVRISIPDDALATGALRGGLSAVVSVDRRTAE
ncbi:HlyD family secretion protein [Falsirhodobacter algicola]|uniref:HlyD family efflux transporter periplasmic adaptor subunit n=1 Tax=Falsirhodobacter algicola TaxID=2692330 RepID=A0A8J8SLG6_9RHOB|nr:HlyD family secretion protein [Falsirhodobacter algicola]QUS36462.1 HlyD family efflux transporter periplasmic adaptor subunit [Falsirhodobacter algicola]